MQLILVLIILGIGASNAKMMSDATAVKQAAAANPTAGNQMVHNQTAISQAGPSIRLSDKVIPFGKKTYRFISTSMKWYEARTHCRRNNYGDLVSILSYAKFEEIVQKFHAEIFLGCMWVGAQLHLQGGKDFTNNWYWVTGEPLSPQYKKWYNSGTSNYPSTGSISYVYAYIQITGNMREGNTPSLSATSSGGKCRSLCEISVKPSES